MPRKGLVGNSIFLLSLNTSLLQNQWLNNDGMCGECGDPYETPIGERPNQAGGEFATGTIVAYYQPGQVCYTDMLVIRSSKPGGT